MAAIAGDCVRAAVLGDSSAFAELVRAETPAAYRLAFAITRSSTAAEDAVQDAFLRAWRDIGHLREPDRWSAWFRRLLVRASLDQARTRRRVREVDLQLVAGAAAPDRGLPSADRLELMRAFGRLPADDRALLTLRYFLDLPVAEVAAALGIPDGTARSRLHRAIGRLRTHLGPQP
jgi:RNA polymerase sigma factor (sigma-70 family)